MPTKGTTNPKGIENMIPIVGILPINPKGNEKDKTRIKEKEPTHIVIFLLFLIPKIT